MRILIILPLRLFQLKKVIELIWPVGLIPIFAALMQIVLHISQIFRSIQFYLLSISNKSFQNCILACQLSMSAILVVHIPHLLFTMFVYLEQPNQFVFLIDSFIDASAFDVDLNASSMLAIIKQLAIIYFSPEIIDNALVDMIFLGRLPEINAVSVSLDLWLSKGIVNEVQQFGKEC